MLRVRWGYQRFAIRAAVFECQAITVALGCELAQIPLAGVNTKATVLDHVAFGHFDAQRTALGLLANLWCVEISRTSSAIASSATSLARAYWSRQSLPHRRLPTANVDLWHVQVFANRRSDSRLANRLQISAANSGVCGRTAHARNLQRASQVMRTLRLPQGS
jgi:hypothetical protein